MAATEYGLLDQLEYCKELVLLHELGHAFGLKHIEPGIMSDAADWPNTIIINGWTGFTTQDLRDIQKHGTPAGPPKPEE